MTNWTAVIQTLVEAKADVNEARQVVAVRLGWGGAVVLILGGGFKHFLFSPLLGEMIEFDYIIFFKWVEATN